MSSYERGIILLWDMILTEVGVWTLESSISTIAVHCFEKVDLQVTKSWTVSNGSLPHGCTMSPDREEEAAGQDNDKDKSAGQGRYQAIFNDAHTSVSCGTAAEVFKNLKSNAGEAFDQTQIPSESFFARWLLLARLPLARWRQQLNTTPSRQFSLSKVSCCPQIQMLSKSASWHICFCLAGPANVWFGVGFNAGSMADKPYAVIVDGLGKVIMLAAMPGK